MTNCKHHPEKAAIVRGLCQACYMRERRADKRREYQRLYDANVAGQVKGVTTRARDAVPVGVGVQVLLSKWSHDVDDKFYAKIDSSGGPDACHVWIGTKSKGGYGMISLAGSTVLAHRMAHALATGDAAAEVVMHVCDNPSCVNPAHLKSGTHMENAADMRAKGRGASGSRLGRHLTKRDTHPRAKRVQTPHGCFPSAALAAEVIGVPARNVARYCQIGRKADDASKPGWAYID